MSLTGGRAFIAIWIGQLVSVVGSRLSTFALGIWVLRETKSTIDFSLIFVFAAIPALLLVPFAGALVDRWDRRRVMMVCDFVCGATMLMLAALLATHRIELWHIYAGAAVQAFANAFQMPAYMASIPMLVPKEHLARANGLVQTAFATSLMLGPALAGVLVTLVALPGVLVVDGLTYFAAVIALALVRIPRPASTEQEAPLLREAAEGWRFVRERGGLVGLLVLFGFSNFLFGMLSILITPLVLSFANAAQLGLQMSIGGAGLFAGGLIMSTWGGPKRRIHGVLAPTMAAGLFLALHGIAPSFALVSAMGFLFFLMVPVMNASQDSIWQTKVPAELQGRCFAFQRVLSEAAMPLGFILAGPLAEKVFEPLLAPNGPLADSIGRAIGTGNGRGIALIFIVAGIAMTLLGAIGYAVRPLRQVENDLADATLPSSVAAPPEPEPALI
jgi:DHA3 family macrolide efflux protein-like MFS transporter